MMNLISVFTFLFTIKLYACKSGGGVYSSIAQMRPLVEIEQRLVKIARQYLNSERNKLNGLKQFAKSVEEANALSKDDPLRYVGNPINSYLLIKRFTSGWKELAERLTVDESKLDELKQVFKANKSYLPTLEEDMVGATMAMFRLQDTYGITATSIANGSIKGIDKTAHDLTAEDCLEIADVALSNGRYVRMKEWLIEAERILTTPTLSHKWGNASFVDLYEYLAWTYYLANNMENALHYTKLVLKKDPKNERALKNQNFYEFYEKENVEKWLTKEQWDYREEIQNDRLFYDSMFSRACRNEIKLLQVKNTSNLVCYYKQDVPRLILKPVKITRVHDNPDVYLFHDVITHEDIVYLQNIATPRLSTAEVIDPKSHEHIIANYRTSKSLFLQPDIFDIDRNISDKLNPMIEDVTDLDTEFAEHLQINNYGLGGQYEFHIDHGFPGSLLEQHPDGNRIATLLYYLSDVEHGGHTVFTKLGLSLAPKKGDAAFWHNLYRNGTGNPDTEHASCPVLSGSKWVMNIWFHTKGNEFRRKCTLNKDE